jgi:hydrogenase maturation protease
MIPDLQDQLRQCCSGRTCFVALGSSEAGDDAFGILLAKKLAADSVPGLQRKFLFAGLSPERYLGLLRQESFDNVVFLDAAELQAAPGTVAVLNAGQMHARFPQVSTHRISLALLAKAIEEGGHAKAWLVATQPSTLKAGSALSKQAAQAIELLHHLLSHAMTDFAGRRQPVSPSTQDDA